MSDLPVRCEPCIGRGYRGRWRPRKGVGAVKVWRIETCRTCGGTGSLPEDSRKRKRPHVIKPLEDDDAEDRECHGH